MLVVLTIVDSHYNTFICLVNYSSAHPLVAVQSPARQTGGQTEGDSITVGEWKFRNE